jgi:large subunit ribosomal protein L29
MGRRTKAADLREQGRDALVEQLGDLKQEALHLRFQLATGQLAKNARVGEVKREIAQVYTVIRERELGLAPEPEAAPVKAEKSTKAEKAEAKTAPAEDVKTEKKTKAKKEKAEEEEVTMELHTVGFRSKDAAVLKQRRRMRRRKCLGEEERAAILLMALSSGVIYA